MDRRTFLAGTGAVLLAAPLAAEAQPVGKLPRVGLLLPGSSSDPLVQPYLDVLRRGLRELGYVEGQSIAIEYRWAEGKYEQLPDLASELVRLKLDVIVAVGTIAVQSAKQTT